MILLLSTLPEGHSRAEFTEPAEGLDLESWFQARGPVRVEADVERRGDQITLRGTATVSFSAPCGRCAREVEGRLEAAVLVFSDVAGSDTPSDEAALEGEGSIRYHDGMELAIDDPVREALILEVPAVFLCRSDCRGLCPVCGQDRNEGACSCQVDRRDPRWQALGALQRKLDEPGGPGPAGR